ncbi:MAG: hemolysin family protein, partial [Bacteroidota bacterium]
EEHDIKIFQNALDLANVRVKACMIPRTEIVALPASSSMEELKQTFIETGHSNILIFEKSIDNIIGVFRLRDLFATPENVKDLIRKLPIVPESMAANKLLKLFVEQNKKLALVVDEFGGTSGLVTLEDVLEEIVGDIEDEHDSYELIERKIGDNEYLFSGRIEIDYINEEYGMSLPESDDYETLAGLVLIKKGDIPKINATIDTGKYIIRVVRVSETRIELLNVKKK